MRIIYTHHARKRMIQRKVTSEQVEETLELPDNILLGDAGEEIAIKQFGTHEVRVIYQEDEDSKVVFTVIRKRTH